MYNNKKKLSPTYTIEKKESKFEGIKNNYFSDSYLLFKFKDEVSKNGFRRFENILLSKSIKKAVYINTALMNANAQLSDKEEDINLVDVLAKKKENIVNGERLKPTKPFGLDKLLMLLKLKAKRAFIIATINMIKKYCVDKSILILEQILNE